MRPLLLVGMAIVVIATAYLIFCTWSTKVSLYFMSPRTGRAFMLILHNWRRGEYSAWDGSKAHKRLLRLGLIHRYDDATLPLPAITLTRVGLRVAAQAEGRLAYVSKITRKRV